VAEQDCTGSALLSLDRAAAHFEQIEMKPGNFSHVEAGLAAGLRRARAAFRDAYAHPGDESFHEWRKSVQLHWRHMQLISRAWPEMFGARIELARQLSQILGDDHDLTILQAHLASLRDDASSTEAFEALLCAMTLRQTDLRAVAAPLGTMLFADRPKRFASRTKAIWKAAKRRNSLPTTLASTATTDAAHADGDVKPGSGTDTSPVRLLAIPDKKSA
jgi:hypothetical protein